MKYSDYEAQLAALNASPTGAEDAVPDNLKLSGLISAISQCLSGKDLAFVLAQFIGDERVTVAVNEKLAKMK